MSFVDGFPHPATTISARKSPLHYQVSLLAEVGGWTVEKRAKINGGVGRVTDDFMNWERLAPFSLPRLFCGARRDVMIGETVKYAASRIIWGKDAGPCKPRQLRSWTCEGIACRGTQSVRVAMTNQLTKLERKKISCLCPDGVGDEAWITTNREKPGASTCD